MNVDVWKTRIGSVEYKGREAWWKVRGDDGHWEASVEANGKVIKEYFNNKEDALRFAEDEAIAAV